MPTPPGFTFSQRLIAALVAALVTVLLMNGAGLLGVVGSLLYLVAAVPVAYAYMRFGPLSGAGAVFLSALAMLWMYGPSNALLEYFLLFAAPSLILPLLLRQGWRWDQAAVLTIFAVVVLSAGAVTAVAVDDGATVSMFADQYVEMQMDLIRESFPDSPDMSAEQQRDIRQFIQEMEEWFRLTYPAIVVLGVTAFVLFQVWVLSLMSGRHYSVPGVDFVSWKAPERLIWLLITAGVLFFAATGLLKQIGLNLLIVLLLVYYIQGLAIVTELFERKQIPTFMRVMGYAMVLLFNPLPLIVAGIGVFDLWIDFRKKRIKGN